MKAQTLVVILSMVLSSALAQEKTKEENKQRLDFAKTYFEIGGSFFPSFSSKIWGESGLQSIKNPASVSQYLTWGGFHFWGHTEFYVVIPLNHEVLKPETESNFQLSHSVATGARFFPWAYREHRIRPYVGLNWGALDFQQKGENIEDSPIVSKDFMLGYDVGVLYGHRNFSLRLGFNYFSDHTWNYSLSKTYKTEIKSPSFALQMGLLYAMDFSKENAPATLDRWNSFPEVSHPSFGTAKFGDFFVGVGPSISYSLTKSAYNQEVLPYLKDQMASGNYFDVGAGYHFYQSGAFVALSFRNPKFETRGYGSKQSIQKSSLAFEINKFLTDYSGFAPYVGLNLAYEHLKYREQSQGNAKEYSFNQQWEPGITLGWDIQPGKAEEALILRTNLRWYPFSTFKVEGKRFDFSQLEYNLIQAVFYPDRLKKRKR